MRIRSRGRKRMPDVEEDRISQLPDEVLGRILSFVPVEDAVRTSILSKRWKDIWMLITNLDFGKKVTNCRNCLNFVDHVIGCVSKLGGFSMDVCFHIGEGRMTSWMRKVLEKNVRELTLEGSICPRCIFSCETLTSLTLVCDSIEGLPIICNLPNLKVLDMSIYYPPSDLMENLFTSCPLLEDLTIYRIIGNGVTCNLLCPHLKKLKIELSPYEEDETDTVCKFVINAPNLEYMELNNINYMGTEELNLVNVKSIVKATMEMLEVPENLMSRNRAVELLRSLTTVKSLSLDFAYVDVLYFTYPVLPDFSNLKHLELTIDYYRHMEVMAYLLVFFPNLEELVIRECSFKRKTNFLCHPSIVPRCLSSCIKVVQLLLFDANMYKFDFVKTRDLEESMVKKIALLCTLGKLRMPPEVRLSYTNPPHILGITKIALRCIEPNTSSLIRLALEAALTSSSNTKGYYEKVLAGFRSGLVSKNRLKVVHFLLFCKLNNSETLFHSLNGCTTLVELELGSNFEFCVPEDFVLPNLKEVSLHSLIIRDDADSVNTLLACPMLEHLTLSACVWEALGFLYIKSSMLKKLFIMLCTGFDVLIDAPNLEGFLYSGNVITEFVMNDSNSLRSAIIEFLYIDLYSGNNMRSLGPLVKGCLSTIRLYLSGNSIVCLLKLHGFEILARLLNNAPNLQTLTIEEGFESCEGGYASFESSLPSLPDCLKLCFKKIEIREFKGEEDGIKFIEYFLKNGRMLEEVRVIHLPFVDTSIFDRLMMFPRHSKTCEILSIEKDSRASACSFANWF
ncbi:hypothetical protein RD792_011550 [Penstemon davidsonii]|uniref:F-box domain-containing protein n=1 Tax=Penstemon davidsonii TaxID=160366 RepID=A0ABR0CZ96_9LAMI|nr:hypothetical protein RD792_011550 [Penstemon davidsonii]